MASLIKVKTGTRAEIDAAAGTGSLNQGEPYLITDEGMFAVGTGTTTYKDVGPLSTFGNSLFEGYIKFDPITLDLTPEAGKLEFSDDRLYLTNVGTQRSIDRSSDVITASTTVSNTTTETTIYTGAIDADELKAGNFIKYLVTGTLSNASASDDMTMRVYIGTTLMESFSPSMGNVTDAVWIAQGDFTVRTIGASASLAFYGTVDIAANEDRTASLETIDTTVAEDLTVTVQWDAAKAGNTISALQGVLEFKN